MTTSEILLRLSHRFIDLAHHHRLDGRQELRNRKRRDAKGGPERQCGRHIPTDHRAGNETQLPAKTLNEIPDLRAFPGLQRVQPCGALRTDGSTGGAIAAAPAELPIGKGDETFFSASRSRPLAT